MDFALKKIFIGFPKYVTTLNVNLTLNRTFRTCLRGQETPLTDIMETRNEGKYLKNNEVLCLQKSKETWGCGTTL